MLVLPCLLPACFQPSNPPPKHLPPPRFEKGRAVSIYPLAAGLDSNFGQDVRVRHFHGYGIRALRPPVSLKLENGCWIFSFWFVWVEVWGRGGGGWWDSHEDVGVGVDLRCGNRDKEGSDGDDEDGGTWTRPERRWRQEEDWTENWDLQIQFVQQEPVRTPARLFISLGLNTCVCV